LVFSYFFSKSLKEKKKEKQKGIVVLSLFKIAFSFFSSNDKHEKKTIERTKQQKNKQVKNNKNRKKKTHQITKIKNVFSPSKQKEINQTVTKNKNDQSANFSLSPLFLSSFFFF
jgi:hypothetical protein